MNEEQFRRFDWSLIIFTVLILGVGVANLYAATFNETVGRGLSYYKAQLIWFAIGSLLGGLLLIPHYKTLSRFAYPIYFLNLLLLVLVLIAGKSSLGGRRWIGLGPVRFQPSEFMKISTVLALAKFFETDTVHGGYRLRDMWLPISLVLVPAALIILQPDLVCHGAGLRLHVTMLFMKIERRTMLIFLTIAAIAVPVVYNYGLKPYQRQRIISSSTSARTLFRLQPIQSMIAIGSGQFLGKGFKKAPNPSSTSAGAPHRLYFRCSAKSMGFWSWCRWPLPGFPPRASILRI